MFYGDMKYPLENLNKCVHINSKKIFRFAKKGVSFAYPNQPNTPQVGQKTV